MLLFLLYFSVKNVTSTSDTRVSWGFTCDRSTGPSLTPRLSIAGLLATSLQAWRTPAERAADLHLPPPPKKKPQLFSFTSRHAVKNSIFFSKHNQEFVLPFTYLYVMHILYVSSLWMFNDRMYFFFFYVNLKFLFWQIIQHSVWIEGQLSFSYTLRITVTLVLQL